MPFRIGVEPHHLLANLLLGADVVLFIHSIREQKLRSSLWSVALSRGTATAGRMSRPSSLPSAIARERPLLAPEAPAQGRRDNHRSPFADPASALRHPGLLPTTDCLNIWRFIVARTTDLPCVFKRSRWEARLTCPNQTSTLNQPFRFSQKVASVGRTRYL